MKHRSVKTTCASLGKKEGKWFPVITRFFPPRATGLLPALFPVRATFSILCLLQPTIALARVVTCGGSKSGRKDGISK